MSKYDDLVSKLKEIFQIDKPQLDFGVYRILNTRADEINDYLENRLKDRVTESLASVGYANVVYENTIFSHLLTFFSRYYNNGDFISQRRFKGDIYAIPYSGEEVVLHWANKDQYYTKSGENFSNYSFKLKDGRSVHFKLVAADTAKDNRKDNDKVRRFVLIESKKVMRIDLEGDEYEEEYRPVAEVSGELLLNFEYKVMPKGSKQDALIIDTLKKVFEDDIVKKRWQELMERCPTENNPQRTLLEKCLTDYTTKNTNDYFIHKDLGGFLKGELDFYIKNEVIHLDDVQNAEKFADIEKNLRMIQCLRDIALDLITFLAQLEDFQKKLWLKKKFVVSAHYCTTLDRVSDKLYSEIAKNPRQWEQWEKLGMLGGKDDLFKQVKLGTVDYLQAHPNLMVDSSLFDEQFKAALLNGIENLEESLDGLLIHGENFQGLSLISKRYRSELNGIYIDPPYNTDATEIIYKNGYKDSSWCSLIQNRLLLAKELMKDDAPICITIDECEVSNLQKIMDEVFIGREVRPVIIEYNHRGRVKSNFAITHEYALWALPTGKDIITRKREISEDIRRNLRRTGTDSTREASPSQFYGIEVDNESLDIINVTEAIPLDAPIPKHNNPSTTMVWPIDDLGIQRRWYYGNARVREESKVGKVWAKRISGAIQIHYHQVGKPKMRKSVWVGKELDASTYGSELLNELFGLSQSGFSFPKSIHAVHECLESMSYDSNSIFLDFFAGSGTTAHAVIKMNRDDGGKRKYILMEQGEYFDTVIKPRIQKIIFSKDWKNGKPESIESGVSHTFKVIKLESYEDTLNNLELRRTSAQGDWLNTLPKDVREDYLLRYMLDVESRSSLLSLNVFKKPFDFSLKVATDSAGASEVRKIDMVETFNYLIGLRIKTIDAQPEHGFVIVTGVLPTSEKTLVIWRDCEILDYEGLNKLCDKLAINPKDSEFEVVYINGDHNIPSILTMIEEEGGVTRALKLRQIEPEFFSCMFNMDV